MHPVVYQLGKRVAVQVGLVAIGMAAAFAVSLALLQDAAIADGVWSTFAWSGPPTDSALWAAAKQLQLLANASVGVGAVLLLAYGVADRYVEVEE